MKIPEKFKNMRPFEPEELPGAYEELLGNGQFRQVVAWLYPEIPFESVAQKMHACKTNMDFQRAFCYDFLSNLMKKATKGCDMDITNIDNTRNYTFISNHRDIVIDSAFLSKLLIDSGFSTTCEIAIGDNLLSLPWVKTLVRINKSFIVERSLSPREMLQASQTLSEYMRFVIGQKHDNVWIAQREGRAKDSNDRTQDALLKMMSMSGEGSIAARLKALHIVPLSISYEFDPCDYLKAQEFQLKRDVEGWKKTAQDDVLSMRIGIFGYKGQVHYHCAPAIDAWIDSLPEDLTKGQVLRQVAAHIDREIHRLYRLYPSNLVATDLLHGTTNHASGYTPAQKAEFEAYIRGQIDKISLPEKDVPFLRERLLEMYANPAINHFSAL